MLGDSVQGNIWWTWKVLFSLLFSFSWTHLIDDMHTQAENADEWDYSKVTSRAYERCISTDVWMFQGLEQGWIPKDPTERLYPNICG